MPLPSQIERVSDRHNAVEGDRPIELNDVAGGDASRHIPTPNMLSETQVLDVTEVNVGLGGKIGNPDGSDDWDAFLSASGEGVPSFGGGEAPSVTIDDFQFGTFQRNFFNFPAQTPATNSFTNGNRRSLARRRARSGAPCSALCRRRS